MARKIEVGGYILEMELRCAGEVDGAGKEGTYQG